MRRLAVLAIVLWASAAHAEKKRNTATLLSGLGTGASSILVVGGLLAADQGHPFNLPLLYSGLATSTFLPSLGEYYAGEWLTIGMAVRIGAVGLATFALTREQQTSSCPSGTCTTLRGTSIALLGVAAIAWIGGIAYDVGDAADAADRSNRKHGIVIVPTLGAPGAGVMLAGYF